MSISIHYKVLSDFLIDNKNDKSLFYEFVKTKYCLNENSFELYRNQFDQFIINHNLRWNKKSKGRKQHFLNQYGDWLENTFCLKHPSSSSKRLKPFDQCSERTKKRRMDEIRQSKNVEEIEGAYMDIIRKKNNADADIISSLNHASPESKENILRVIRGELCTVTKYSPDEALALMVDLNLTTSQYIHLYNQGKQQNSDIYPPYNQIVEAKGRCYPSSDSITVSDYGAAIALQSLVDHTTERLIKTLNENKIRELEQPILEIIFKWGLDGASGQSCHKQTFTNDSGNSSDASVFVIAMVPLVIKSGDIVVWKNPQPSSTKLCRPIKFDFMKESRESTNEQYKLIDDQIEELKETVVINNGQQLAISHKFYSTMVDGKSINYLTENPSHGNCHICQAKPSQMNDFEAIKQRQCNDEYYAFGISSLHCWIRFLECLLHISYRLRFKKWKVCTVKDKKICKETKERIQLAYRLEKGKCVPLKLDIY